METEEIKRFLQTFSIEELKTWMEDVIKRYEKWAKFQIEWRKVSRESIRQIQFPYAYREGQKELKDDGDGVSGGESSRRRGGR